MKVTRTDRLGSLPRLVMIAAVVLAITGIACLATGCGRARTGIERLVSIPAKPWVAPAVACASSQAESAVRSAALLDDPGPPQPSWPTTSGAEWIARYRGNVVTSVRTDQKLVALTFDDGPDGTTVQVVDILDAHDAHATFFFRGESISFVEVGYAVAHGNEIGNHTASHVGLSGQSSEAMTDEIDRVDQEVFWVVGRRPLWVRARAGSVSTRGLATVAGRGQLYANWSASANDTDWSVPASEIADNVVRHVRPGSIVLLHQTRPDTIVALPAILSRLKAEGYRFVTLSELAAEGQP